MFNKKLVGKKHGIFGNGGFPGQQLTETGVQQQKHMQKRQQQDMQQAVVQLAACPRELYCSRACKLSWGIPGRTCQLPPRYMLAARVMQAAKYETQSSSQCSTLMPVLLAQCRSSA
jgi:hypothetical protein